MKDIQSRRGQVLVGAILILLVLLIMIPALVQWTQIDAKASVQNAKTNIAFNLAQAAVERGMWKAKSSTGTWQAIVAGNAPAGYKFDATYRDVPGGTYRIKIADIGLSSVTIVGEGRDDQTQQTRAISAVFKNQSIDSPLMASQGVNWNAAMCPLWGPIMSQGNIFLVDSPTASRYFPRKYAKGVVISNDVTNYPRDTNGLLPPNTDNVEWWSDYQYVPELPILDFAALRADANATHTLNVYGCANSASHTVPGTNVTAAGPAPWDTRGSCGNIGSDTIHFSASFNHPAGAEFAVSSTTWYYDGDLILGGDTYAQAIFPGNTQAIGLWGSLIVRGNLTLDATGDYDYAGNVPVNAWAEMSRFTKTTNDTASVGEYPADNGLNQSLLTWNFGTDSSNFPGSAGTGWINTVGIRGFTYVGGDLTITNNGFMDFNGAVWVNGSVTSSGAGTNAFCGIYFDDTLTLPTLNVVLIRQSWNEVAASSTPWP